VAYTQYKLDAGAWNTATKLTIAAPANHSDDRAHTVVYRSIDDAGNIELARSCSVRIDTRRPTPLANWAATVRRGHTASLAYSVRDPRPGSPTANVTIRVKTSAGRLVKRVVVRSVAVNKRLVAKFVCHLAKGRYRFSVCATDAAGNAQSKVASNRLTVR
jgi:hypothetical protein